jgi:hypothetical protein
VTSRFNVVLDPPGGVHSTFAEIMLPAPESRNEYRNSFTTKSPSDVELVKFLTLLSNVNVELPVAIPSKAAEMVAEPPEIRVRGMNEPSMTTTDEANMEPDQLATSETVTSPFTDKATPGVPQ